MLFICPTFCIVIPTENAVAYGHLKFNWLKMLTPLAILDKKNYKKHLYRIVL